MKFTVKQARQVSGKTQEQIAKLLGFSTPTYRKYEKNPEKMTMKSAENFCRATGFGIDDIFFDPLST
ncbi:Cro-like protein, phage associated [Ruminococcaceae bacterium BL-4]|jgi:DNA-binding XRE family transcriptional regulator|nr:Cro-like protein, phage associated [Ruminococcaceae bacterium BL-4]